jgi:DNA-binding GntR family transcriptional regulator
VRCVSRRCGAGVGTRRRAVQLPGMVRSARSTVKQPYLWQHAAASLRRAILTGELKNGDRISEAQLAEDLGVSRAPIRDAMHVLVHDGLLEQEGGSTFVRGCSKVDIQQLHIVRLYVERLAIRLAAGHIDSTAEAALQKASESMMQAALAEQGEDFAGADIAFHRALCRASGNRWLVVTWETLASTMEAALALVHSTRPASRLVEIAERHHVMLDYLIDGDSDGAERVLEDQMRQASKALRDFSASSLARVHRTSV